MQKRAYEMRISVWSSDVCSSDDLDAMSEAGGRIATALRTIPGAADVQAEQTSGAPTFDIKVERQAAGRYGLSVEEVASTVAADLGGREAEIGRESCRGRVCQYV